MKLVFLGLTLLFNETFAGHHDWKTCSSDSNCVTTHGVCGGCEAVNLNFKKPFERHISKMQAVSSCLRNDTPPPPMKAVCWKTQCHCKPSSL